MFAEQLTSTRSEQSNISKTETSNGAFYHLITSSIPKKKVGTNPYMGRYIISSNVASTEESSIIYLQPYLSDETSQEEEFDLESDNLTDFYIQILEKLFQLAREIDFEYGIKNKFSLAIEKFVNTFGNNGVDALRHYITYCDSNSELVFQTLRTIGNIQDRSTHRLRRWLLVSSLQSQDPIIRDGAGMGLDFMGDPSVLKQLQEAVDSEVIEELREDLLLVVHELELIMQERID